MRLKFKCALWYFWTKIVKSLSSKLVYLKKNICWIPHIDIIYIAFFKSKVLWLSTACKQQIIHGGMGVTMCVFMFGEVNK